MTIMVTFPPISTDPYCNNYLNLPGATVEQALQHFLSSFENGGRKPTAIGFDTFYEYFADLSACVDDDSYFDALVRDMFSNEQS